MRYIVQTDIRKHKNYEQPHGGSESETHNTKNQKTNQENRQETALVHEVSSQ